MQNKRVLVGFYKDKEGETRPVTKSTAELQRKKVIQNPRPFKTVQPRGRRVSVTHMVKEFYPYLSHPLKNCSTWYTYYYLSEFANLPPRYKNLVKLEFNRLSEGLDKAFLNYGTYAVVRELRHVRNSADFRTKGSYRNSRFLSLLNTEPAKAHDYFMEMAGRNRLTRKEADLVWTFINNRKLASFDHKDKSSITEWLRAAQKAGVALTPKEIIKVGEGLFRKLEWNSSYGGRSWQRIARTMRQREKVTRTIWIDMMWAIQHNTGTWLNKVESHDSHYDLRRTLDAKREGNMRKVGATAARYNPRLHVFLDFLPSGRKERPEPSHSKKPKKPYHERPTDQDLKDMPRPLRRRREHTLTTDKLEVGDFVESRDGTKGYVQKILKTGVKIRVYKKNKPQFMPYGKVESVVKKSALRPKSFQHTNTDMVLPQEV